MYLLYDAQSQTQFISFWVIVTYSFIFSFGKLEMHKKCLDSTKQLTGIQQHKFTYEKKRTDRKQYRNRRKQMPHTNK